MARKPRRRAGAREIRTAGAIQQRPFRQVSYKYRPLEIVSTDEMVAIHNAGLTILEQIGFKVLSDRARSAYAHAGFDVDETSQIVRFDRHGIAGLIATAPDRFTLHARNPAHDIDVGGNTAFFSSVGGPAYAMDLDKGRRAGTYAEMCDWLRLVQSLNIIHQEGGGGFEALDLPAETRHLDLFHAQATLMDKNWLPWTMGRVQTMDAITMAAIALGKAPEDLAETPALCGIINTNSPLQLDVPMAEGLMTLAGHGQAVAVTPFTLAGAMSPVTLAGALAQQHAEAMAGIALAQIVRPGAPVLYGAFTSNVDMKTGSPAFGTPEYALAQQVSAQLARHLSVPLRSSSTTASNAPDAQAAYESMMSLWGVMTGGAHMIKHAAGWLCGGLAGSFEKLIIDAEMLQMMAAWLEPFQVDDAALALDAIKEAGPGGHFFGTAHTMERYETAFNAPLVSNWDNYDTWVEQGSETADVRANKLWKQLLRDYQPPPIDPATDEALRAYVTKAKEEGRAVLS